MDKIEKYLKKSLERFVFIELKSEITKSKLNISFLKDVPIPIEVAKISKMAREIDGLNSLPFDAIVEGMTYVIGVDKYFRYNEQYRKFLELANEKILEYITYKGLKKTEEEEFFDAAIYFRAVVNMDEKNINGLYNYAKCCRDIFNESEEEDIKIAFRNESVNTFEKIVNLYPDFGQAYYFLGYFYMNSKLYEKAKITWQKFLTLDDNPVRTDEVRQRLLQIEDFVIYEKGYTRILNEDCVKGLEYLLPLLDKYSDWWNLLFFIGLAYRKTGEYDKAIDLLKKVLMLKPSQSDAMNELGLCYSAVEDFENAEKYFKKALLINQNDYEIMSNLAVVYINKGEYTEAERYLLMASEIAPEDEIVKLWVKELKELIEG